MFLISQAVAAISYPRFKELEYRTITKYKASLSHQLKLFYRTDICYIVSDINLRFFHFICVFTVIFFSILVLKATFTSVDLFSLEHLQDSRESYVVHELSYFDLVK